MATHLQGMEPILPGHLPRAETSAAGREGSATHRPCSTFTAGKAGGTHTTAVAAGCTGFGAGAGAGS
eukprot:scaffold255053_cov34-Prasinocladus_malaysianus.AAC.1